MASFTDLPFEIHSEILLRMENPIHHLCLVNKQLVPVARGLVTNNYTHDLTSDDIRLLPRLVNKLAATKHIADEDLKHINLTTLIIYDYSNITGSGLKHCKILSTLYLIGGDKITGAGLSRLPALKKLQITNATLTDADLQQCTGLTELDIAFGNGITNEGLRNCSSLTSLSIRGNMLITDDGLKYCRGS